MPTVGRKIAAIAVDTARLINSAMLMPLERIRVGISSESASQTQTPGPTAKKAMKQKMNNAVSQPLRALGTGVIRAFSIFSGAALDAARLAKGFLKKASTELDGRQSPRLISTGFRRRIVGADGIRGRAEIADRIDDDHRGRPAADRLAGIAGRRQQGVRLGLVERHDDPPVLFAELDRGDALVESERQASCLAARRK